MSTALPPNTRPPNILPPNTLPPSVLPPNLLAPNNLDSAALKSSDFITGLIDDQQSLTAVERFSARHDQVAHDRAAVVLDSTSSEPSQAKYYRDLLPASPPSPGTQYAFEVDLDKCSGCKACVVACHSLNGLDEDEAWRRVGTLTLSSDALPVITHVTTACHHCEDPGCLSGCPVKAYVKDESTGIVRHLDDQCIGCKYCTMMCPYEVPRYNDRLGIVRKCDMCHQRLSVGEAPACVQACPNEAIAITVVSQGQVFSATERIAPDAPLSSITRPTTRYVGRSIASDSPVEPMSALKPQDWSVDCVAESHWPLAAMLIATQISVGMIVVERVASLLLTMGGAGSDESLVRWNASLALLIAMIGMGVAPLHLGQPLRAWRVFLGLKTSWLSREAVVLGKYVGLLSVAVALLWLPSVSAWFAPGSAIESLVNRVPTWADRTALGLSIPIGIVGLYSSAMIYIATGRRLWRMERTMVRFLGTALVCGLATTSAVFACTNHLGLAIATVVLALAGLFGKLAYEWTILHTGSNLSDALDHRSRNLVKRELQELTLLRFGTAAVGSIVMIVSVLAIGFLPITASIGLALGGLLISAGEFGERLLYFKSVVYDRMPGTLK
jgi:formate dehydrogenase iron-sulfur subunit